MGVFLAIFALMMMDVPLPWKKALPLLIFGILGTMLQNLVRIEAILFSTYWWGWKGLSTVHRSIPFFIFPLWYALFAYIYLKQAGWKRASSTNELT